MANGTLAASQLEMLTLSGTGVITIVPPNTNTNRTLTLPDVTGTVAVQGGAGVGKVLQVVSTTKSDVFTTTSGTYVDVTGLAATITPTSSSSKILVIANLSYSASTGRDAAFQILRGATVIPTGVTGSVLNGAYSFSMFSVAQSFLDSPATTSATTYKIQVYVSADTIFVNRRALDTSFTGQSTITLMEIAA
jgi:hypothetical protein